MRLSIIIRTWNRLEYTIRTIMSIHQRCGLNKNFYEIICVDQGSTDGTREWLKSVKNNGYYPVRPVFMEENYGDGMGMQAGIERAEGEFIAQHDNDIELISPAYYRNLINIYDSFARDFKICALGGTHKQGVNETSKPYRLAREKLHSSNKFSRIVEGKQFNFTSTAWVTASYIFRKKFTEGVKFGKGMCNVFCGEWFDRGYENFACHDLNFWHIDSTSKGGEYVARQAKKFPDYTYVKTHYKNFI